MVNGTGWLDGPLRKKYGQSLNEFLKADAEPGSAALGVIGMPNRPAENTGAVTQPQVYADAAEVVPARSAALNGPMYADSGLGDTSATVEDATGLADDGYLKLQVSSGALSPEEELMVIDNIRSDAGGIRSA